MRVLLVTSAAFPPHEGLGYHLWSLAGQLKRQGHRVGIITRGSIGRAQMEVVEDITLWRLPYIPAYPLHVHLHSAFVNRFLPTVEAEFDLVNAHSPLPAMVRTRLPLVTTVHSPMGADTAATRGRSLHNTLVRLQTPFSRRVEHQLFARSRKITVVARWVVEALAAYGIDPSRVVVTGNGVETSFLAGSPEARRPYALYVGRFEPGKGLEDLVEAARIYYERCPDTELRFVLAGSGSLSDTVRALAARYGLEGRFDFPGQITADRRAELVRLYRQALMFVLPSHHEGMPTVLLEAMAAGTPVISTAVGGALEAIRPGQNGLLTPVHNPAALADALMTLTEDVTLQARLGGAGRETVTDVYSWGAVAARYEQVYRDVLHPKGRFV